MTYVRAISRRSLIGYACLPILGAQEPPGYGVSALLEGDAWVRIPAGEFLMGSENGYEDERPVHRVRITQDFEIGKYEVTQAQWRAVMSEAHGAARPKGSGVPKAESGAAPSRFPGAARPVENVSFEEVQGFLARLSARSQTHRFRLPTEAEWEYAARAGETRGERGSLADRAWYKENSGEETHPIGQARPNASGLYDIEGNVAEWVSDWYGFEYYQESPVDNPHGPETGSYRVFRGGCWSDDERACRNTARRFDFPVNRFHNVGFRLVRVPK
jgi:formylglycine-generating enzyme required for sulfatase activity